MDLSINPFLGDASAQSGIEVVVPIFNAYEETVACLESVARQTTRPFALTLINDGSTDARIDGLLRSVAAAALPHVRVVSRADNRGFVRTANEGLVLAGRNDVVLLNSDTVVASGWLEKLFEVAHGRPDVATVTPLTNSGTLCSIPDPWGENPLPAGYDVEALAALVARCSGHVYPEVPTGVGFCLYIRRRAIDVLGGFDEQAFGRGYGEENDFCQRAMSAGMVNLIADHAFVFHAAGASFGKGNAGEIEHNVRKVAALHPTYPAQIERLLTEHPLQHFHAYLKCSLAAGVRGEEKPALRVLHVSHALGGGTAKHIEDLASIPDRGIANYVLSSNGHALEVEQWGGGRRLRRLLFPLRQPLGDKRTLFAGEYRRALWTVCWALGVNVIHVHQLLFNTLDIADVARRLGLRYLVSAHDYYVMCPRYALLDAAGRRCRAVGSEMTDRCDACLRPIGKSAAVLDLHRQNMAWFLAGAEHVICPSEHTRDALTAAYPALASSTVVIEHGHPESVLVAGKRARRARDAGETASPRGELAVAILGGLNVHKGIATLRGLLRANRRREITIHFFGNAMDREIMALERRRPHCIDGTRLVVHGPYARDDIVSLLVEQRIQVGIQPSLWEETFSYTLSEMVAAGIPVIGAEFGAVGARIRRNGLGWTVRDPADPHEILAILERVLDDPGHLERVRTGMRVDEALEPLVTMWEKYLARYRALLGHGSETAMQRCNDEPPDREYIAFLAMQAHAAESRGPSESEGRTAATLAAELEQLRAQMRSPRYWVADRMAGVLHRVPVVWPLVARVTDAVIRSRQRRGGRTASTVRS